MQTEYPYITIMASKYQFLINKVYKARKTQFRHEFFSSASPLEKKVPANRQHKRGIEKCFSKVMRKNENCFLTRTQFLIL